VKLWHANDYKSAVVGVVLRKLWPMYLVSTGHGWVSDAWRDRVYYMIERFCLRYYDRVICVSREVYNKCLASGVRPERCLLVDNVIDVAAYSRKRIAQEAKQRFGLSPGRCLIGAVGRLAPEKGFEMLIRAVSHLLKAGLNLELWIIGEGDQKSRLEQAISDLGCNDHIRLLGFRPDVPELYEAMDVFVVSSVREGLPRVLLEAMAVGVPVVATRVGDIPQLIRDGESGLLIEPGRAAELAEALERLVRDSELRSRIRESGFQAVQANYRIEKQLTQVGDIYRTLFLDGCRDPRSRGSSATGASNGTPRRFRPEIHPGKWSHPAR
jgi:glycosyltransferase involved in cell wall biosynthesis